ncbi:MAG TPA: heme ABC exporter ATP-binding protein CcmA [Sphingomonadaceae bacterium]|nr:heme ABC exporter ATP-binding protein CcmA [Sphingomonadaceae bacterium]
MPDPAAPTPPLMLEGVACIRGGRLLFEGLDLVLAPGEAVVVSGQNGVGKSSLLRLCAGLLPAAAGRVRRGRVALADEALALDPRQPLAAALRYWAVLDGGDADAAMAAMGLADLADVPVRMLSTGQRRRAGLSRAIAARAQLWLLDEPVNGLDADATDRLGAAVARHRAEGGAVLAAAHGPLPIPGAGKLKFGQ